MYVSGPSDRKFVAFYAVVLTLIRYFVNEILLEGLASVGGVKPEKRGRFKDQGWQCMYYLAAFVTGLNLLADTEWGQALFAGDTKPLFQDYPVGHIELTASFKYYYLLQVPSMPPLCLLFCSSASCCANQRARLAYRACSCASGCTSCSCSTSRSGARTCRCTSSTTSSPSAS